MIGLNHVPKVFLIALYAVNLLFMFNVNKLNVYCSVLEFFNKKVINYKDI